MAAEKRNRVREPGESGLERPRKGSSRGRRIGFRIAAAGLGLGLLVCLESICHLAGWGKEPSPLESMEAHLNPAPLFVPNGVTGMMVTNPGRRRFFQIETFARRKPAGAFRIFCLGGSTTQGNPFGRETAFSTWLRLGLEAADARRTWEVINCGGLSYPSYRVSLILDECLAYEPDLIVLCTGHNEFLEARGFQALQDAPAWVRSFVGTALRLRIAKLAYKGLTAIKQENNPGAQSSLDDRPLREEVDAILDYHDALKVYHRNEHWRRNVTRGFEESLVQMARACQKAEVPLILVRPVSNLRDCPPFKSEHRANLADEDLARWKELQRRAAASTAHNPSAAISPLEQAVAIDPRFALTWYQLGRAYASVGRGSEARAALRRAREEDVCPLRIIEPMEQALRRASRRFAIPYVDWSALLSRDDSTAILGNEWLLDHVHPNIEGHRLLGEELTRLMSEKGWLDLPDSWTASFADATKAHLNSLPQDYVANGLEALKGLRAWTRGEASGPEIEYWRAGGRQHVSRP